MRKTIAILIASTLGLAPFGALAQDTKAPVKSERAMTPDSAKDGGSPGPKSERAMDAAAGQPGAAPNGKSERALNPAQKND